ncbi:MAG: hypothetical protein O2923_08290 [Verrucomicrobia bacterium]|nr:hypothetical protein [Verrucomicrobiota bacterium]MDA1087754.1 hypothetical protein [Verrucomicrobiota bacterium]
MFTITTRRKITGKLRTPVRPHVLGRLAEELMQGTRYQSTTPFLQALEDEGVVQHHSVKARNGKSISLYGAFPLDDLTPYELAGAVFPEAYFCNLTAIYHHGLTDQVPKAVYLCSETICARQGRVGEALSESRIRSAFIKPSRHTNFVIDFKKHELVVLDRERGSDHGVIAVRRTRSPCPNASRVACLERALIDAVVAPHYNGGVSSLLAYFRAARKKINHTRMMEIYRKLAFVYPYAQSLGFFLEHADMRSHADELRDIFPPRQRFFVDHSAKSSWAYDERWMLYHPEGLVHDD